MIVLDILTWCQTRAIILKTRHIPGKLNDIKQFELPKHNTTDRVVNLPDCPQSDILRVLKPMSDLFATQSTTNWPYFASPVPDHKAWAMDALSLEWKSIFANIFLPFMMILQVLSKVQNANCTMILIAQLWPQLS